MRKAPTKVVTLELDEADCNILLVFLGLPVAQIYTVRHGGTVVEPKSFAIQISPRGGGFHELAANRPPGGRLRTEEAHQDAAS